jgi:hypothetical protein
MTMTLTQVTTGGVDENINIDSNTLKVDGTNNRVGVGTDAPQTTLHVKNTTEGNAYFKANSGDGGADRGLAIKSGTGQYTGSKHIFDAVSSGGQLEFRTAGSPALFINQSQRIGIGTTSPVSKLDLGSDTGVKLTLLQNNYSLGVESNELRIASNQSTTFYSGGHSGTERLRIDGSGNVGIGIGSPESILHVVKNSTNNTPLSHNYPATQSGVLVSNNQTGTTGAFSAVTLRAYNSSGTGQSASIIAQSTGSGNSPSLLFTQRSGSGTNAERLRIDSAGRLLIGTSSAIASGTEKVQIKGDSLSLYDATSSVAGAGRSINFRTDGGATGAMKASISGENDGSYSYGGRLVFKTSTTSNDTQVERMRIDSSGVVKINQSSTGNIFRIQNTTSGESSILIQNSSTGYNPGNGLYLGIGSNESSYLWNYHNEPMIFGTNNVERARFDTSGRFLLAVTAASSHIHNNISRLFGNLHLGANMTLGKSGGDYDGIGYNVGWQSSNGQYKYVVSDTSAFIKFGEGGGRVSTYTAGSGTAGNSISFTSGPYVASGGTSWTSNSDERLKTNLSPIENGLAKVGTLRAVTGRFLTDKESTSRAFLIAQDVQTVLPEAVDDYDPECLGLDYPAMIPLLVAALKEAKNKIETLETKVAALEAAG